MLQFTKSNEGNSSWRFMLETNRLQPITLLWCEIHNWRVQNVFRTTFHSRTETNINMVLWNRSLHYESHSRCISSDNLREIPILVDALTQGNESDPGLHGTVFKHDGSCLWKRLRRLHFKFDQSNSSLFGLKYNCTTFAIVCHPMSMGSDQQAKKGDHIDCWLDLVRVNQK